MLPTRIQESFAQTQLPVLLATGSRTRSRLYSEKDLSVVGSESCLSFKKNCVSCQCQWWRHAERFFTLHVEATLTTGAAASVGCFQKFVLASIRLTVVSMKLTRVDFLHTTWMNNMERHICWCCVGFGTFDITFPWFWFLPTQPNVFIFFWSIGSPILPYILLEYIPVLVVA